MFMGAAANGGADTKSLFGGFQPGLWRRNDRFVGHAACGRSSRIRRHRNVHVVNNDGRLCHVWLFQRSDLGDVLRDSDRQSVDGRRQYMVAGELSIYCNPGVVDRAGQQDVA